LPEEKSASDESGKYAKRNNLSWSKPVEVREQAYGKDDNGINDRFHGDVTPPEECKNIA
jgi:hypothetical protein